MYKVALLCDILRTPFNYMLFGLTKLLNNTLSVLEVGKLARQILCCYLTVKEETVLRSEQKLTSKNISSLFNLLPSLELNRMSIGI